MRFRKDDDGERGQIMLLSLGFGVLALALVLVVAAASSIYLERKQLLALADGAAADAADAIDYGLYYAGEREGLPLSDASVQEAVGEHLESSAAASTFRGLRVAAGTGTNDGRTAHVTLTAVARPVVVPWALVPWSDGFAITVTSSARAD
ncbi:pilus assembly protein TadG-related protein [Georgenia phoenicis]|uniref:pilus assembly protein TadG-related protein n=1 Tax=unclassified Georgenia TaxID=2626815 RepID=UPI0039AF65FE